MYVILPNFMPISQTAAEIWRFLDLKKRRPPITLDLLCTCLDHPQRVFRGLCHCIKIWLDSVSVQ